MVREYAFIKMNRKLFLDNLQMVKHKVWPNFTIHREITFQDNLKLIRKMVEEFIDGMESNHPFIRDSSKQVEEMVEEHFGGQMDLNMQVIFYKANKLDMVHSIEEKIKYNMKEIG